MIPEVEINEIVGWNNPKFEQQQVDFYLPQAKLVIEIDGQQHKTENKQRVKDADRDKYLIKYGINTIRIDTHNLRESNKIQEIKCFLSNVGALKYYKIAYEAIKKGSFSSDAIKLKLLPTAIIRFELLLIELLLNGTIEIGTKWNFNICCDENLPRFAELAIEDVCIWLNQLSLLRDKKPLPEFDYSISVSRQSEFRRVQNAVNINFSLLKRYTDECEKSSDIYVRTDYFDYNSSDCQTGRDKNYFKVSTIESINYRITDKDKPVLVFFLQNLFNKEKFRDGQYAIIANALNLNDTIGLLPTGGGKSLCYQLPCLLQPSINFVVCPIKSLMYDQEHNLHRKDCSITNVSFICGDQRAAEKDEIMKQYSEGQLLFVLISPERFQVKAFREILGAIVNNFTVSYAVIDEVHCLSEWGHDFRTSYLNLTKTIDNLSPKDKYGEGKIKFIGLTATASVNVLKDIKVEFSRRKQQLDEGNIKTLIDYSRKELIFNVINDNGNKWRELINIFEKEGIPNDKEKSTLIFTPYVNGVKGCYQLSNNLSREFPGQVAYYSGKVPEVKDETGRSPIMSEAEFDKYKARIQVDFNNDKYQVLCATKAFGMGIDKQNIFYTIHYGLPSSVEALYQEAGRAGRWDKNKSENKWKEGHCYVLHTRERDSNKDKVKEIFSVSTSVYRMKDIQDSVSKTGGDIFTQFFLFIQGIEDIKKEQEDILKIIDEFYREGKEIEIKYDDIYGIGISPDRFEKEIYRLCLLGIVEDWTRDFVNFFNVRFTSIDNGHILSSLKSYINKYDPDEDVEENINKLNGPNHDEFLKKAVWYLLDWIFRHIIENRKQSLKTLSDWCTEFESSEQFKQRIDSYFTFNESTFVLQHVAEHTEDFQKWFEVFYSQKKIVTDSEFMKLRDRLSRFLEGYHNSQGLNFVSGFVRLKLNDFENEDGRNRMSAALNYVKKATEEGKDTTAFFDCLLKLLDESKLTDNQMQIVCSTIIDVFPQMAEQYAAQFQMPYLCNDTIDKLIEQVREIKDNLIKELDKLGYISKND